MRQAAVTGTATTTRMRSRTGVYAALVLLAAIPVTALISALLWPDGAETLIHLGLATGFVLVALAVPEFTTGTWTTRIGVTAMAGLAAVFAIQGISESVDSANLHRLAFDILGQGIESVLLDMFLGWCVFMLLTSSHGKTLTFGSIVLFSVISLEASRLILLLADAGSLPEATKLAMLLVPVWFLLESRKPVAGAPQSDTSTEVKKSVARLAAVDELNIARQTR